MFKFIINFFKELFSIPLNIIFTFVNALPAVPRVTLVLDALDFITKIGVFCSYFLPMGVIGALVGATVSIYAFHALISLLKSKYTRALGNALLGAGSNIINSILNVIKTLILKLKG